MFVREFQVMPERKNLTELSSLNLLKWKLFFRLLKIANGMYRKTIPEKIAHHA